MKIFLKSVTALSFTVLSPLHSYAWNATGHALIAHIAYENLKPDVRSKVDKLVSYFHNEYPEINSFADIAPWADTIRGQRIETFTHWHYIDVAFSDDGTQVKDLVDTDNAVWALKAIFAIVKNEKANAYERARFLAFLTHIVGDLHQPLHTVSRISAKNLEGDRGGNLYFVFHNKEHINLHRLWDGGVGAFENNSSFGGNSKFFANHIMAQYPKNYFNKRSENLIPEDWLKEGMNVAKQYVYNTPEEEPISKDYVLKGQAIAQEEIALAGYRLAGILNSLL